MSVFLLSGILIGLAFACLVLPILHAAQGREDE